MKTHLIILLFYVSTNIRSKRSDKLIALPFALIKDVAFISFVHAQSVPFSF
jgi:hypothetical protein